MKNELWKDREERSVISICLNFKDLLGQGGCFLKSIFVALMF